jgi:hypothetical protein
MIHCKNKKLMTIPNWGVEAQLCTHFGMFVNDEICKGCSQRVEGETVNPHPVILPKRSPGEIEEITKTCHGCPLFNKVTHACPKTPITGLPTDTYAQNPSFNCPENKW